MADMVKEANVYDQVAVINNSAQKLKSSSVEGTTFTVALCPPHHHRNPLGGGGGGSRKRKGGSVETDGCPFAGW